MQTPEEPLLRASAGSDGFRDPFASPPSVCARACAEAQSLLKWSMLAACTVGPGTVVVCAKAGADFDLQLLWALCVALPRRWTAQPPPLRPTLLRRAPPVHRGARPRSCDRLCARAAAW